MNHPLAGPMLWDEVADGYTAELLPVFSAFAAEALRLAAPERGAVVLDVAAGPGTLALMAAPGVARVVAVDFSTEMIRVLRQRAKAEGIQNVEAREADGQRLPFDDAAFDVGFSMFGLMFFPNRAAGFKELHRVLKPGGRAVVASWAPLQEVPVMAALFSAIGEHVPDMPFGSGKSPLAEVAECRAELEAAGFKRVDVHRAEHGFEVPSVEHFWEVQQRSSVAILHLRRNMDPARWAHLGEAVTGRLRQEFGAGPFEVTWTARLGTGET